MKLSGYDNWKIHIDERCFLQLALDKENAHVNSLNEPVMRELETIIDEAQSEDIKAIIISSAKETGFIAGADIDTFKDIDSKEEAVKDVLLGQQIFQKLEDSKIPTVAVIRGFCLGGGLELALACHYRVAADTKATRLGLPEVKLGLNPGWGGTIRLPKLIGAPAALNLILSGHTINPKAAEKMGLVDVAAPERHLKNSVRLVVEEKIKSKQLPWWLDLTNHALVRPLLARAVRKTVQAKALPSHYPAPFRIIDDWASYGVDSKETYQKAAETFGDLFVSDTSKNLIRVYYLQERMKHLVDTPNESVKTVHVVGAGIMGGDIAAWCALRGLKVTLQDREAKFIAPAIKRAHDLFKKKLKKPRLIQEAMDRLTADIHGLGIATADVIIEAIYENLEAKQALFKEIEEKAKPDALLATNTSSIPLEEIKTILPQPERLIGIHFFNPVAKMPLVEVVHDQQTSQENLDKGICFVKQIGRLPLPVKSSPGFLVNRVLMPYLMECVNLMDEGFSAEAIDKAALEFGMPMGPVELADTVGLDICLAVATNLSEHFGGTVPERLKSLVDNKRLGRKTSSGFYEYKNGKPIKSKQTIDNNHLETITNRLILRLFNEAIACLREGIVEDGDLLDAGMIFGTGFAPFKGGPIQTIKAQGLEHFFSTLESLEKKHGDRFQADPGWKALNLESGSIAA